MRLAILIIMLIIYGAICAFAGADVAYNKRVDRAIRFIYTRVDVGTDLSVTERVMLSGAMEIIHDFLLGDVTEENWARTVSRNRKFEEEHNG